MSCTHATALSIDSVRQKLGGASIQRIIQSGTGSCSVCASVFSFPNLGTWACLHCDVVVCSREHLLSHLKSQKKHVLSVNLVSSTFWCSSCNVEPELAINPSVSSILSNIKSKLSHLQLDVSDTVASTSVMTPKSSTNTKEAASSTKLSSILQQHRLWSSTAEALSRNMEGGQCGLSNLGNTCFMNACLQGLLHCPPLIALFCQYSASSHSSPPSLLYTDDNNQNRAELVRCFADLVNKSASGSASALVPRDLIASVRSINRFFRPYEQHDAQEFLRCVIDNLDEGMKRWLPSVSVNGLPLPAEPETENADQLKRRQASLPKRQFDSPIGDLFNGRLMSQVRCESCGFVSSKFDSFYDLSLEIPTRAQAQKAAVERQVPIHVTCPPSNSWLSSMMGWFGMGSSDVTLDGCLHHFCAAEELRGDNQYRCSRCKCKVDATKRLSVVKLPEILVLHVKRFSAESGYFDSKLGTHIVLPSTQSDCILDMRPYLAPADALVPSIGSHLPFVRSGALASAYANLPASPAHNNVPPELVDEQLKSLSAMLHPSERLAHHGLDGVRWQSDQSTEYDLYAIVKHIGGSSGGHYVAFGRCQDDEYGQPRWFEFDDRRVSATDLPSVANEQAYVLFYIKRAPNSDGGQTENEHRARIERALGSNKSKSKQCLLSLRWLRRALLVSEPGPIDNWDLCCEHGIPRRDLAADVAIPIAQNAFAELQLLYGGGPLVMSDTKQNADACAACAEQVRKAAREEAERVAAQKANEERRAQALALQQQQQVEQIKKLERAEQRKHKARFSSSASSKRSKSSPSTDDDSSSGSESDESESDRHEGDYQPINALDGDQSDEHSDSAVDGILDYFVVDAQWVQQWNTYCKAHDSKQSKARPPNPGPIDNRRLFLADGVTLRSDLRRRVDYVLIKKQRWRELVRLQGGGGPAIVQRVRKASK